MNICVCSSCNWGKLDHAMFLQMFDPLLGKVFISNVPLTQPSALRFVWGSRQLLQRIVL